MSATEGSLAAEAAVFRAGVERAGCSVVRELALPGTGAVRFDYAAEPGGVVHSARVIGAAASETRYPDFVLLPSGPPENLVTRLGVMAVRRAVSDAVRDASRPRVAATSEYERLLELVEHPLVRPLRLRVRSAVRSAPFLRYASHSPGGFADVGALLTLGEVGTEERFARAVTVLADLASGVPAEWAFRRLAAPVRTG